MLALYLSWRVIRLGLLISSVFTGLILFTQLLRLMHVVSSLPLGESFLLMSAWSFYLFVYFLPTSLLIASVHALHELKESKKLLVVESFGMPVSKLLLKTYLGLLLVIFGGLLGGFLITQEDVSFLRRYGLYKHYSQLLASVPEKTFYTLPEMSLYMNERTKDGAVEVFFYSRDVSIFAQRARFEEGRIIFEKGSVLHQEGGKSFVAVFDQYTFNLQRLLGLEKKSKRDDFILHVVNHALFLPLLALFSWLVIKPALHLPSYYLSAIAFFIYQLVLLLVKNLL